MTEKSLEKECGQEVHSLTENPFEMEGGVQTQNMTSNLSKWKVMEKHIL